MHIQANRFVCTKSSIKNKNLPIGKVTVTGKFVTQVIKDTGFKVGCFIGFFYLPEKNLLMQNNYIDE